MKLAQLIFIGILSGMGCSQAPKVENTRTSFDNSEANSSNATEEDVANNTNLPLKDQALEILEESCASCHNLENAQGGFGSVLDIDSMIKSGRYLVPGQPEESAVFTRLAPNGNMPPSGAIEEEKVNTLKAWISELETNEVVALTDFSEIELIRKDLEQIPSASRPFIRYFSLRVSYNAKVADDILEKHRLAFLKTINSLSFSNVLAIPQIVDDSQLIYRVDLSNLALDESVFDQIINDFYPFSTSYNNLGGDNGQEILSANDAFLQEQIQTQNYLIRMDWFNSTATLPALYKRFLDLPETLSELELKLGVDRLNNLIGSQVTRSGFRNSGVSSQNRIIERHTSSSTSLPYWISYDFADNNENKQNIFNFPLGPVGVGFDEKAFDHDGGEVIFQLPNGLLAYYLNLATGEAIDKGPLNIVSQLNGPVQLFRSIVNGMSCMSCHGQGILYKKDEIREFAILSQDLSDTEKSKIFEIFPNGETLKNIVDRDNATYFNSLNNLGIDPQDPDPINISFQSYNKKMFRFDVQQELGISEQTLNVLLNSEPFRSQWVSIYTNSGSITRQEFNNLYGLAIQNFIPGMDWTPPTLGDHLVTPACIFVDPLLMDSCTVNLNPEIPEIEDGLDPA